jgi:DNA polymerase III sliding clamp (beta) subunit (PCNA family)
MKLTTPTLRRLRALLAPLNLKTTLSYLTHLHILPLLESNRPAVVLTATDLDVHFYWPLTLTEPTTLTRPTSCSIEWLLMLTRSLPKDGWIEFKEINGRLNSLTSAGISSLCPQPRSDSTEMPAFETVSFNHGGWLNPQTLQDAMASSAFMSTDETRYVLNGVFFETDGTTVATNGRYLGFTPPRPGTAMPGCNFILPPRALKCLSGPLLPIEDKPFPFWVQHAPERQHHNEWSPKDLLACPFDTCLVKVKLIDGNYPNYRQVIPKTKQMDVYVTLSDSTRDTLAYHSRSTKLDCQTYLQLHADHSVTAVCTTGHPCKTPLSEPFPAGTWTGTRQPFDACFNTELLLPCLDFSGNYIRLCDPNSPMLGGYPGQRQTVLMPMRAN